MPLASITALYITDEKPSVNELGGHRHFGPIFFIDVIKKHCSTIKSYWKIFNYKARTNEFLLYMAEKIKFKSFRYVLMASLLTILHALFRLKYFTKHQNIYH